MLKLYKDRKQVFECKIKIENATLSNARARLILSGPAMDYAFKANVDVLGNCMVDIPPLRMMEHSDGAAVLEVMVEGGFFEPLKTDYKLVTREVTVAEVKVTEQSYNVKVKVDDKPKPIVEKQKVTIKPKIQETKLLKTKCSKVNTKLVKGILEGFNKLDTKNREILKEHIEFKYTPSKKSYTWANKVFNDPNSTIAKMVMYKLDV